MILHRRHVPQRGAVRKAEQRKLLAFEFFLNQKRVASLQQLTTERERISDGVEVIAKDFYAFATGESVIFYDVLFAHFLQHGSHALQYALDVFLG